MSLTVADLVELRQLVDRYADAVDRRDGDSLSALFADGGVLQVGDGDQAWIGPDVARSLETLSGYEQTFHHVGGAVFDPGDDPGDDEPGGDEPGGSRNRASGRVHCLAHHYQRTESGPVDLVMAVRYLDSYVRSDELHDGEPGTHGTAGRPWRIAHRRVSIEWTELHPAHPRRRRTTG